MKKLLIAEYFKALNLKNTRKPRIAVLSCMYDGYEAETRNKMWDSLLRRNLDLVLMIGDNAYLDKDIGLERNQPVQPKDLWRRNAESRNTLKYFKDIKSSLQH